MMARYKRDELVCVISDALGHDLASRAIGRSSFPISISDGDVRGKGKVGIGIATSPTAWAVPNSNKAGRDGSASEHKKRVSANQG